MASASEQATNRLGGPRPLRGADLAAATKAIVAAFAWHEPWGEWALPDASERERVLTGLVERDLVERFLPAGECWTIGGACVTLWIPPPSGPDGAAFASRREEDAYPLYGDRAAAMRAADELISSMKPPTEHFYLDTIATDPAWMRRGLGGRLLDHDLAIRDERGEACALDTHTAENVDFYARRGFEVIAEAKLPEGGPDLYMMHRPARR